MKNGRRWLWAAPMFLALAASPVRADEDDAGPGHAPEGAHEAREEGDPHGDRLLRLLGETLELNKEQKGKAAKIIDASKPKMKELNERMKAVADDIKKIIRADSEKIRAILTDEQKEKFDELKVRLHGRMKGRYGMGPKGQHGGAWWRKGGPKGPDEDMGPPEMMGHPKGPKGPPPGDRE